MRKFSIALALVAVVLAAAYSFPLFSTHSEQDACTFGPVTNAQYRIYRAQADRLTADSVSSGKFGWDEKVFAGELKRVFDEISKGESSFYARVAIIHSIMRSLGAFYNDTIPSITKIDPYLGAPRNTWLVTFSYTLDVNKISMFSPLERSAWIIPNIAGSQYKNQIGPNYPNKPNDLSFIVHLPNLLDSANLPESRGGSCPPIPSPQSLKSFLSDSN